MNKKYTLLTALLVLPFGVVYGATDQTPPQITGKYAGDFSSCYQANLSWGARTIEDFVCLERAGDWQEVLSQIVLDREFQEIDQEIEEYIASLEEAKGEYFWPEAKESFLSAVDAIESSLSEEWYYWKRYKTLCQSGILSEVAKATGNVVNIEAVKYLWGDNRSSCLDLVRTKLSIAKEVSYSVLKLNKTQVRQDQHEEYVKQGRVQHDELADVQRDVLGNLERMLNGWPTKTRNTAFFIVKTIKKYFV